MRLPNGMIGIDFLTAASLLGACVLEFNEPPLPEPENPFAKTGYKGSKKGGRNSFKSRETSPRFGRTKFGVMKRNG